MLLQPFPLNANFSKKIGFLHGIACTHQVWAPLIAQLPKEWGAFAPDLRFHGQSRLPSLDCEAMSIRDYAQDLVETLQQARFNPAWLVGHSMGARVAVAAALLNPEGINGLVLADHPISVSSEEGKNFRIRFRQFLESLPQEFSSLDLAIRHLNENCPDPSSTPILFKSFVKKPGGEMELPFDKEVILKTFDGLPEYPFAENLHLLGQRGIPVLTIRGGRSPFWTHEDWEKSLQNFGQYKSFKFLEMKEAGHALPFERGEPFLRELISFINKDVI